MSYAVTAATTNSPVCDLQIQVPATPLSLVRAVARRSIYFPLVFFAARGLFSFQSVSTSGDSHSLYGGSARNPGFLGSIVLPAVAYGIALILISSRWNQICRLAHGSRILLLLAVLPVLSTAWSQDPAKSFTFGLCYLIDTLFAFFLVTEYPPEQLPVVLSRILLVLSVVCIFLVIFFPTIGIEPGDTRFASAWRGIFAERGGSARVTVFLLGASLEIVPRLRTRTRTISILLGLFVLANSHAVSALLVITVYCIYYAFQKVNRKLSVRSSTAFLIVGTSLALALLLILVSQAGIVLRLLDRDPTLTGRTEIWAALVPSLTKRPILGYGFYAFCSGMAGESGTIARQLHWVFGYAHNGLFEIMLQLGFAGLAMFTLTLLNSFKNAWRCIRFDKSRQTQWYVGVVLLTVIYNVDDCTVLYPKDLLSILYVVACCQLAAAANRLQRVSEVIA